MYIHQRKNLLLADISKSGVLPCVCLPLDRRKLTMIFGNIVWIIYKKQNRKSGKIK